MCRTPRQRQGWHGDAMQCITGKASHPYSTAKKLAKKASRTYESPMLHYKCTQCTGWHVGSATHKARALQILYTNHDWRAL